MSVILNLRDERWRRNSQAAHEVEMRLMWGAHNRAVAAAEREARLCERLADLLQALVLRLPKSAIPPKPTGER